MKKRAALYVRVSTKEQKVHGISVNSQIAALKEYCDEHDYSVVDVYNDAGISARKKYTKRPALLRLLDDCKHNKVDVILFTRLDRWFRAVADYYEVQSILDDCKVAWRTIWEDYETETSQGIFKVNIMLSVAQAEADRDSEKIKSVLDYKRQKGEYTGGNLPYGYTVIDKKVVKDPKTRDMIEDMFKYYFATFSKSATATYIIDKYNPPQTFTSIHRMIANEAYTGKIYGIENFCEGYITKEEYEKLLSVSNEKHYRSGIKRTYIFSGLMRCPICGYKLAGRNKKNIYKSYRCDGPIKRHKGVSRAEKKLEKYMLENLSNELDSYILTLESNKKNNSKDNGKKIKQLTSELGRINLMFEKGRITEEYYDKRYEEVESQLKELKKETNVAELEHCKQLKASLPDGWQEMYKTLDDSEKQVFWKNIVKEIKISSDAYVESIIFF